MRVISILISYSETCAKDLTITLSTKLIAVLPEVANNLAELIDFPS